ncbi:L-amino acid N-acyltransferase YncA [Actinoplanes philippinensis]|uniref:L-amino acid N-acyltransferase YncA n=1 Tax=Actinoplanes philippinensis TaxID=35752 RepID=A0A1I2G9X0_9ACTN|nr:GNAT family N-acetyltransferase [Actinoplanes philippinensis]SFF13998.1 L-amino acid N-acyltransferase YncA [Actinoplanes philippinensis]
MTVIRTAETDADLAAWRQVRQEVVPGERNPTVAELRAMASPRRLLLLAESPEGHVTGSGVADESSLGGGYVSVRVIPAARRRGIGTALLLALARWCAADGHATVSAGVQDPGSLAFATRFGFAEIDREVEQVRTVGAEPDPVIPAGITIVTVAERPELWEQAYHDVYDTFGDMALTSTPTVPLAEWTTEWITTPEASFLALAGSAVVGVASLLLDPDDPGRAENGYTAVRRAWRGRGIAGALKRTALTWAARHGIREVYTWTQQGNDDMRAVNERLGYRYGEVSIRVRAPLPLPGSPLPGQHG